MTVKTVEVPPLSKRDLEAIAVDLTRVLSPSNLEYPGKTDVVSMMEFSLSEMFPGWELSVERQTISDVMAYSDFENKRVVMCEETYQRIVDGSPRDRFTGVHEFSHVALHRGVMAGLMLNFQKNENHLFRKERKEIKPFRDPEWQADYLTGCLLMPLKHVMAMINYWRNDEFIVQQMVSIFNVSRQAALIRLKNVKGLM